MKTRLIYLLRYAIFWLVFFIIARFIFLFYHHGKSFSIPMSGWFNIFFNGIWMDVSMSGYLLMLTSLVAGLFFFSGRITKAIVGTYTIILLFVFSIIALADLELYRNWHFRIDATPLFFLMSPREAAASLKTWQIALFAVAVLIVFAGCYYFFRIFVQKIKLGKSHWLSIPMFIFISAATIIPIRGGLGLAAMNPGKVYFSHQVFYNHAALNVVWNFLYSVLKSRDINKKYPEYISEEKATRIFGSLMSENGEAPMLLNTRRPNIVMIILEGVTSKAIEPLGGKKDVTPCFNSLVKEGLLFTNFYASGDRSNKGLVAILSGFPAQPTQAIMKNTLKAAKLPSISKHLSNEGYHSSFYYGGDPDFSNIRAYIYQSGFQEIISQSDFPRSLRSTKWGIHDEFVFDRLLTDLATATQPFFKVLFTLSSHEPFDIPCEPRFPGDTEDEKFLSSISYTDHCLGEFFQKARTKSFYDHTLFIILADHGHRSDDTPYYEPLKFAIPMLWPGGALNNHGINNRVGCQTDLAKTLLAQMDLKVEEFQFSHNLIASSPKAFAYYAFNDGFGFVTPNDVFIWDHISRTPIQAPSNDSIRLAAFSFFNVYQNYFLGL